PHTRTTEYKHLTGQKHGWTSITREYPTDTGDPYYPIPAPENAALYRRYEELADRTPGVSFTGRLGTYRYYNMDQVVAQSLTLFARIARTTRPQPHRRTVSTAAPGHAVPAQAFSAPFDR